MQDEFPYDPFLLLLHQFHFFLIPRWSFNALNRPPEVPLLTEQSHRQLLPPTMGLAPSLPESLCICCCFFFFVSLLIPQRTWAPISVASSVYKIVLWRKPTIPFGRVSSLRGIYWPQGAGEQTYRRYLLTLSTVRANPGQKPMHFNNTNAYQLSHQSQASWSAHEDVPQAFIVCKWS